MDLNDSELFRKCKARVRTRYEVLHNALVATMEYDQMRQTTHSRVLYFEVELLLTDYITGRTK
jgi:hypothetical protein